MTAKEFLRQYGDCEKRIRSKERKIKNLKEQADSITQTLSERVQSSGSGDRQAQVVEAYIDMQRELAEEVLRFRAIQRQVCDTINALEDNRQIDVLERYYIEGMTFEQTAVDLHYSFRQVLRHHGVALVRIKDVIECHTPPVI